MTTLLRACACGGILLLMGCDAEPASDGSSAFRTSAGAYLDATAPGVEITPLATVGDILPGSKEPFAPIPDGIGVWAGDDGVMNLMLNHELGGVRRIDGGLDYRNAMVSHMRIDAASSGILSHRYVIDGSEGYAVLCSATWVDEAEGFHHGYFFTGEEHDYTGLQLAIDESGAVTEMPWVGFYAHENQAVVPGFTNATVLVNFDDTDTGADRGGRDNSELYMYVGESPEAVMTGRGMLYVLAPKEGESGNVGDLAAGDSVVAEWKRIPADIALNPDGTNLQAYVDSIGVFGFVRVEDGWYDKRPGQGPAVMFYTTGRDERVLNSTGTGPADPWGSFYYVDFDPADPTADVMLTLMARSTGPADGWANPDNGDMLADGTVMLMEDPANNPWTRAPGIFRLEFTGDRTVSAGTMIAQVDDPDCGGYPGCRDMLRTWESSGIVDASEFLGPGAWLVTVQAHSKPVPSLELRYNSGQLLLLRTSDQ